MLSRYNLNRFIPGFVPFYEKINFFIRSVIRYIWIFIWLSDKFFSMHYHAQGLDPPKRHTQFRKEDGTLYSEELFSTEGFRIFILCYIIAIPRLKLFKSVTPTPLPPSWSVINSLGIVV